MPKLTHQRQRTTEAGFILPTALIVLFIITVLAGTAVTVAVQSSTSTTRDDNVKAALEAAEAGLQVADYRLNKLEPTGNQCINGSAKKESESECKSGSEPLGNGATYTYQTTPELKSGECAGLAIANSEESVQRCITATGESNGVSQRLQARVASSKGRPLFPVHGIIGLEKVGFTGNMEISAGMASNGEIGDTGNSTQTGGCELGPSGSWRLTGTGSICSPSKTRTATEGKLVLAPVTPGKSATSLSSGTCVFASAPEANCDYRITNGIHKAEGKSFAEPYDPVTGWSVTGPKFEPTNRVFEETGSATLKLEGGVYNFCKFNVTGNFTLEASPNTEIFIDAPEKERAGSKCPSGSGEFNFTGNLANASNLLIYVYGKGPVNVTGNSTTDATIYAPEAPVKFTGNVSQPFTGGIAAKSVTITGNFSFNWDEEDASLKSGEALATGYARTAWAQCTSAGTNPKEGC